MKAQQMCVWILGVADCDQVVILFLPLAMASSVIMSKILKLVEPKG